MNSSDRSDPSDPSAGIIPPHGGYRKLRSFQIAEAVFDGTAVFCDRFVDKRSRTHDQMVQGARSGCRNIAEGSEASATSKKTELKLTNVAKASLEELLLDYEAFLRQRRLPQLHKDTPEALAVRGKYRSDGSDSSDSSDPSDVFDACGISTARPEVAANTLICLINQATYLLKRQIKRLERDFLEQGGITERLYRRRVEFRQASDKSDRSDKSAKPPQPPACPQCGKPMRRRTARKGQHEGQAFWGCSAFPDCRGIVPISAKPSDKSDRSDSSDSSDESPPPRAPHP